MYQKLINYKAFVWRHKFFMISIILALLVLLIVLFQDNDHIDVNQTNNKSIVQENTDGLTNYSTTKDGKQNQDKSATENKEVFVDIKGEVKHPKVYKMTTSDRVSDVLKQAELTTDADTSNINLSEKLVDQKMIVIPKKGQNSNLVVNQASNNNNLKEKVNLNLATEDSFKQIPGIGQTKAKAIIEFRTQHGSFNNIEQLRDIKGFGNKTYDKLKEYFTL
ncbi:helix-hairpin-helix domain-containing protein [Staphylococcus simiae]|uniref:helix-hairpin-helix domain-containing protein n=2 Tax=Staphylococcus simiae TaxID=308354 RepID=UPI001A990BDD|nr:helix-hairpin-helix domain-containing protein [Staphylococcus simiae]MBO1200462.1 helix-hairpin-helix domain-containing protein [Staphylococcus simiae]MBO1202735.1 helix-hairpin-helix domain-containing protein [Staphylococcus simiae]MBO1209976.1 helix-hairpin-helix domain-containing protein [Staphylococcus simiae]